MAQRLADPVEGRDPRRGSRSRALWMVLFLFVAACGGGGEKAATSSTSSSKPDTTTTVKSSRSSTRSSSSASATCRVDVTGDVQFHTDQPGRIPANSDYWLSDQELRSAAQVHSDYDARVAAGQQLLQILQVACGDPEGVLLATTDETTRTDVPQAPGTYSVLNYLDKAKPGIAAALTVPGDALFGVSGGQVTITRFDDAGVAGTFTLQAEEISLSVEPGSTPKAVSVTGEFDFPCFSVRGICS